MASEWRKSLGIKDRAATGLSHIYPEAPACVRQLRPDRMKTELRLRRGNTSDRSAWWQPAISRRSWSADCSSAHPLCEERLVLREVVMAESGTGTRETQPVEDGSLRLRADWWSLGDLRPDG